MTVTTPPGPRTPVWAELRAQAARLATCPVAELFERDPRRFERFTREQAGLLMDFSRQRLDEIALAKLLQLADAVGLRGAHRCHVARRAHQRHRGPRGAARGAAPAARCRASAAPRSRRRS